MRQQFRAMQVNQEYDNLKKKIKDLTDLGDIIVRMNMHLELSVDQLCGLTEHDSRKENREILKRIEANDRLKPKYFNVPSEHFKGLPFDKKVPLATNRNQSSIFDTFVSKQLDDYMGALSR